MLLPAKTGGKQRCELADPAAISVADLINARREDLRDMTAIL